MSMKAHGNTVTRLPIPETENDDPMTWRRRELVELLDHLTRGNEGKTSTAIAGLKVNRLSTRHAPKHAIHEPVFSVIAQGNKRLAVGDETFAYDPMHYLVSSVDLPVLAEITEASDDLPYLGISLSLDSEMIGEIVHDEELAPIRAEEPARGLYVSRLDVSLLDAVLRLLRLLETPEEIAFLAPMIQREIVYRLMRCGQGVRLRQLALKDSQTQRIAAAIRLLRERFDHPLSIADLADDVHMSVSSLHHHFKAVTAISPLQFQKQLRLQEARRLLLGGDIEVTAVAHRVGYESPSQFSREYRRFFGLPPQRDRQRWRQGT